MKKSFRPTKSSSSARSSSRPSPISRPRPSVSKPIGSHPKESFGHVGSGPIQQGPLIHNAQPRWYHRHRRSLIGGIVGFVVLCCLLVACVVFVAYLVSQGTITIPGVN